MISSPPFSSISIFVFHGTSKLITNKIICWIIFVSLSQSKLLKFIHFGVFPNIRLLFLYDQSNQYRHEHRHCFITLFQWIQFKQQIKFQMKIFFCVAKTNNNFSPSLFFDDSSVDVFNIHGRYSLIVFCLFTIFDIWQTKSVYCVCNTSILRRNECSIAEVWQLTVLQLFYRSY